MLPLSLCRLWQPDRAANAAQDTRSYTTAQGTIDAPNRGCHPNGFWTGHVVRTAEPSAVCSGVLAGTTAIGVRHRVAVRVAGSQPRAAPVRWRHDTDQAASLKARVCGRLAAPWNAEGYHFDVSLCVDLET